MVKQDLGFPGGSDNKESTCSAGDPGSIPGSGRSPGGGLPGGGHGHPRQYSCLENPHGQRSLAGYSPWGHEELDTTERLTQEARKSSAPRTAHRRQAEHLLSHQTAACPMTGSSPSPPQWLPLGKERRRQTKSHLPETSYSFPSKKKSEANMAQYLMNSRE